MTSKRIHVVKRGGSWGTLREGGQRLGSKHETQHEAIDAARTSALKNKGEVIIHRPDGRIRDSDSYGNDPHPPKDKKH
jgi:hypothetical protein